MTKSARTLVGTFAILLSLVELHAESLPPPTTSGSVKFVVETASSQWSSEHAYAPPAPNATFTIYAESKGASSSQSTRANTTVLRRIEIPGIAGVVVTTFVFDSAYAQNIPEENRPFNYWRTGPWPAYLQPNFYQRIFSTTTWDAAGKATFDLKAVSEAGASYQIKGAGVAPEVIASSPTIYPASTAAYGPAVTFATNNIERCYFGMMLRYLPGSQFYFTRRQNNGDMAVFHVDRYDRLVDSDLDFDNNYRSIPLGTVTKTGSEGKAPRSEYEEVVAPVSVNAMRAALQQQLGSEFNDANYVIKDEHFAHYSTGSGGASANKLRYKFGFQPGIARTITWAETFTPEGQTAPTDYAVKSEKVSADASETSAYIINPFERFGGTNGIYKILIFNAALSFDANGDGKIVSPGSPVTPYVIANADHHATEAGFFLSPNFQDHDDDSIVDSTDTKINGVEDLQNFHPVFLDLRQLITSLPPEAGFIYKLKQADNALNFVYTNLTPKTAFAYRSGNLNSGFGPNLNWAATEAPVQQITATGINLFSDSTGSPAFLNAIQNLGGGIILVEARGSTNKPIVVGVEKNGQAILEVPLPLLVINAQLAIDNNRDGTIKLASEDASDATSENKPFRFWLNDDIDRKHTVDDTDSEEDDISPAEAGQFSWQADYLDGRIESKRDLEDFSRLWIYTQGLNEVLKSGDLKLGLKWTDTGGTTPAIQLFQAVEADGGLGYLTDDAIAANQLLLKRNAINLINTATGSAAPQIGGSSTFALPTSLFASVSETQPKIYLLFEGCSVGKGQLKLVILKLGSGSTYEEIGEGPGVWMDLKKIGDMYEHWSVGNGNGDAPMSVAGRVASVTGSGSAFSYSASSPEEQKYILFVHGWNMEKWEKERFAETAYKRLWWQGYKGCFGLFSWPTTNNFDSEMDAILDSTNFDRGEFSGWRSATPLRQLMQALNSAYGGELYVFSHSMGGVVTSEALRLQSDAGGGQIAKVYVASQAALSGHAYDGTLSTATGSTNALQWDYNHPRILNGTRNYGPATPNIYKNWMAFMLGGSSVSSKSVGTLVNFYNENDWALSAPVWQFNQITKPDDTDLPSQPYQYDYTGDIEMPPFDGFRKMLFTVADATSLTIGSRTALADRYEIMAFAAESRVKALGATPNISQGITRAFNIRTIWPSDADSHSAHKWHSGEFRSTIQRQGNYWKAMLGQPGFQMPTLTLP